MKVLRPGSVDAKDMESRSWAAWCRDQYLDHATYTPVLTARTNVSASTPIACQYSRVGNLVTVSGSASVTATAAGTTAVGISLPVPSNFDAATECAGTASTTTFLPGYLAGDTTNDEAKLTFSAAGAGAVTVYFSFIYWVQ